MVWSEVAGFKVVEGVAPVIGDGDGLLGGRVEMNQHGGGHALDFAREGVTHLLQQGETLVAHFDALREHLNGLVEHSGTEKVHIDVGNDEAAMVDVKTVVAHLGEIVDLSQIEEGEIGIVVDMLVHVVVGVTQLHCGGAVERSLNSRDL